MLCPLLISLLIPESMLYAPKLLDHMLDSFKINIVLDRNRELFFFCLNVNM